MLLLSIEPGGAAQGVHYAPDARRHFNAREDGWTKVVFPPAA